MNTKQRMEHILGTDDKINLLSGGIAGIWAMTATHPLERVKTMRILGIKEISGQNFLKSIYTMAKLKGPRTIFRGNAVSWIREFPGAGLMFFFYERFKTNLTRFKSPNDPDLPYRVMSGALAGISSSTITYSLDPVKTVMSGDYDGRAGNMRSIINNIYRKQGLRGFYHGYAATMCSVTPFIGKNYNLIAKRYLWFQH